MLMFKGRKNIFWRMNGYYCIGCGSWIKNEDFICKCCGSRTLHRSSSRKLLQKYYDSNYYQQTGNSIENVVSNKGRIGEFLLDSEFEKLYSDKRFQHSFQTLYNVLVPEPNGSFQEIDCMLLCGRNIFVFECKNRKGNFYADYLESAKWRNLGDTDMYSPILQNDWHIAALKWFLNRNKISGDRLYNITVLGKQASIRFNSKSDDYNRLILENCYICHIDEVAALITKVIKGKSELECLEEKSEKSRIANRYNLLNRYSQISQEERSLYFKEREARKEEFKREAYKYYYKRRKDETGAIIVRTNGVYYQYLDASATEVSWHDAAKYGEEQEVCWCDIRDYDNKYNTRQIQTPLEMVRAYNCTASGEEFTRIKWKEPIIEI